MPCVLLLPALTLYQVLLEGQVLPCTDLIDSQLIAVEAQVHPAACLGTQRLHSSRVEHKEKHPGWAQRS